MHYYINTLHTNFLQKSEKNIDILEQMFYYINDFELINYKNSNNKYTKIKLCDTIQKRKEIYMFEELDKLINFIQKEYIEFNEKWQKNSKFYKRKT